MPEIKLAVRQLVEFLRKTGSIDSRFTGFDRANEGARIHRRLQKAAGEGYAAEVFLTQTREVSGIAFTIEGRADGIFEDEHGTTVIDEIKTTALPAEELREDGSPCHWAQGMVYGAIYAKQKALDALDVRLTYYQIDTDEIVRYTRHFTAAALDAFFEGLLRDYGQGGSWTGPPAGTRACRPCAFPLRRTAPGSGRWRGKFTVPARAASGCFVRPPPASARP